MSIRPVLASHLQRTLEALADGHTVIEMAQLEHVSPNTVKQRLRTLYEKLNARNQAHAVAIAFRLGVLDGHVPTLPCVLANGVPLGRLIAAREDAGITLRVMASRLSVPLVWLWRRERGEALFPLPLLERYTAITGLDLDTPDTALWSDRDTA